MSAVVIVILAAGLVVGGVVWRADHARLAGDVRRHKNQATRAAAAAARHKNRATAARRSENAAYLYAEGQKAQAGRYLDDKLILERRLETEQAEHHATQGRLAVAEAELAVGRVLPVYRPETDACLSLLPVADVVDIEDGSPIFDQLMTGGGGR